LAFHPEGKLLACGGIDWLATGGSDGAICIWDVQQPSKVALFEFGTTSLAFHPSGRWLAAASLDEAVLIWDVATQKLANELGGHKEGVSCIAYSPDGRWLASGGEDRTLRLWDAETQQAVSSHQLDTPLQSLAFSPDGRFLYTGNGNTTCFQLETARLLEE
jgi:WD40 repeat protein